MADVYKTPGSGSKNGPQPLAPPGRTIAMTPTEHYVVAEAIIEELTNALEEKGVGLSGMGISDSLALAQVHATLAQAAPDKSQAHLLPQATRYDRLGNRIAG